ncbi:MAG: hypothetical protein U0930_26300 [Pirellulales bacterium]
MLLPNPDGDSGDSNVLEAAEASDTDFYPPTDSVGTDTYRGETSMGDIIEPRVYEPGAALGK